MSTSIVSKKSKPKIAILTIKNSYKHGGVFACVKHVYKFCEKYFDPTVFCLSFDKEVSTSLRSLKFSSDFRKAKYDGMNYVEIGARWAFWEPGHYGFNLDDWKKALRGYEYFFVVSGNSITAYPLVQLNKKFAMWIAAPYQDDREQRVNKLSGLRHFINKMAFLKMQEIEKKILQKADFIWALSSYTKKRFEEILGTKRDNMIICNFPMELKQIKRLSSSKKEKRILAVGRFSDPRKNVEMLIRVFDKLYQIMPELKLYVVGMKPSEDILPFFSCPRSF